MTTNHNDGIHEMSDVPIVVHKVGGSCLQSAESLEQLMNILELYKENRNIFVASAFQGVTDKLIEIAKLAGTKDDEYKNKLKELRVIHEAINTSLFSEEEMVDHFESTADFFNVCLHQLEDILEDISDYGMETFRLDSVASFGEKLSTFVLTEYLESRGLDSTYMPADQLIVTDDRFGNALPLMDFTSRKVKRQVVQVINRGSIPCITGFIGLNKSGYTTTLGRGGSDYTASILANCLAESYPDVSIKVILWKNVDGILSAAPESVETPLLLEHISFAEAKEIAYFGAKVLHPKCVVPLEKYKIPLEIRNFEKPLDSKFTLIDEKGDEMILIKGVSIMKDVAMVTAKSSALVAIPGVLAKIFTILGEAGINVSFVSQSSSEVNTTFCVSKADGQKAYNLLKNSNMFKEWFEFVLNEDIVVLGVIGQVDELNVKDKVFVKLDSSGIKALAVAQSADGLNISIVIDAERENDAIQAVHECCMLH
ncbi:MAG TPA: aspartate kinase [Candidatus Lokiarchaeia archaeon]|nr:aspartate kinase [Candidatus Lokiarchaeia archaeon]